MMRECFTTLAGVDGFIAEENKLKNLTPNRIQSSLEYNIAHRMYLL